MRGKASLSSTTGTQADGAMRASEQAEPAGRVQSCNGVSSSGGAAQSGPSGDAVQPGPSGCVARPRPSGDTTQPGFPGRTDGQGTGDRLIRLRRRYRRLLSITLFLTFDLIIFGAFVRLVDAGLGCPDWPGCYGHVTPHGAAEHIAAEVAVLPDGPVTVFKAWVEMLHRYIASGLGLLVIALLWLTVRWRRLDRINNSESCAVSGRVAAESPVEAGDRVAPGAGGAAEGNLARTGAPSVADGSATERQASALAVTRHAAGRLNRHRFGEIRYADGSFAPSVVLAVFTLVWIILQGLFGMWTVTLRLMPVVVTAHLLGAQILFMALMAQQNRVQPQPVVTPSAAPLAGWSRLLLVLLIAQLLLGGWVSSNYAALGCEDFPLCHGSLWPDMDLASGFELWRPLGTQADGEPLEYQALTGIHYMHRLMAYVVFALAGVLAWRLWRLHGLERLARLLAAVLLVQFITGLANVFLDWPLVAALAHTAGAAGLVGIIFMIDFRTHHAAGFLPSSQSPEADRRGTADLT